MSCVTSLALCVALSMFTSSWQSKDKDKATDRLANSATVMERVLAAITVPAAGRLLVDVLQKYSPRAIATIKKTERTR